jgi:two-component system response regulator FixJ
MPVPEHGPTVFIVDDDAAVRRSLKALLEANGYRAEVFGSAASFLEAYRPNRPGCLIVDLRMPRVNGFGLQAMIRARGLTIPLIFLSAHGDVPAAVHAMRGGALAFIEKSAESDELLERVAEALDQDAAHRAEAERRHGLAARLAGLTRREREVMALMVEGRANKEIAHGLGISIKTVEIHRARVMQKTGTGSLPELVRLALDADPDPDPGP